MDDVIIIGAGASGLIAARILSSAKKKVTLLEARERTGGRVFTIHPPGFTKPVESGAEFIHGNLPVTKGLLNEAGIAFHETSGKLYEIKNDKLIKREDFIEHAGILMKKLNELDHDIPVSSLLNYFPEEIYTAMKRSLRQYMEGYNAADIGRASSLALKEDWESEDEEQYRIEGGYGKLIDYLENECINNGCIIHLNNAVKKINWKDGSAEVITENKIFKAEKVIITVPPVLISNGSILFEPELDVINAASIEFGFGGVIKIILEFDHRFWETGEGRKAENMFFVFSEEIIPTWWAQLPDTSPVLTGWLAGPVAEKLSGTPGDIILQHSIASLASIFDISVDQLKKYLVAHHIHDWCNETFSMGGYSYNTTTSAAAKEIFSTPVANTLFFAGEAYAEDPIATVEGALRSGISVAEKILNLLPTD
jgi:monoamine oxidase